MKFNPLSKVLKDHSPGAIEVLDSMQEIVWITNLEGECLFLNNAARSAFNIDQPTEHLMQESFFNPIDAETLQPVLLERMRKLEHFTEKVRLKSAGNQFRWHQLRINPLQNSEGRNWLVIALDVEEETRAAEKLQKSYAMLEVVLENSPEIILINNCLTHENVYSNKGLNKVLGFSDDYMNELGEKLFEKHIHPDDLQRVRTWLANVGNREGEFDKQLLHRIRDAKGKWRWLNMKSMVFSRNSDGEVTEILNYMQDVSSLKDTEERLQSTLNFIKQIAQTSPDLILIYDYPTSKVVYTNQIYSCFGYPVDVLKSRDDYVLRQIIYRDDWYIYKEFTVSCEVGFTKGIKEAEYRIVDTEGEVCWLRERARVFKSDDVGRVKQVISIIQDVTESKKVEESNRENELLSRLIEKKDEFMSVASHELKTPITTMKAAIQILKRLVEKNTDQKTLLVFISKADLQINKLTSLISDLLDNAKIQAGKMLLNKVSFNLSEVVEDCIAHISNHHAITIQNEVDREIVGDKIRIEQVLINFLSNAVKYSPDGGEIIVRLTEEGHSVKISVTDSGIGIPEEKIHRLFDRFYRVDNKSQEFSGLGLGLYISAEIIKQHGGGYGVSSEVGKGSTFWFSIPFKEERSMKSIIDTDF